MKVLFYVGYPLAWARGGFGTQILETKRGLEALGCQVEWLRHDAAEAQQADILHYWGRPPRDFHWQLARSRGIRVVISELHAQAAQHPVWSWPLRGALQRVMAAVGGGVYANLGNGIYTQGDAAIAVSKFESDYMLKVYRSIPEKTHIVPNGVGAEFLSPMENVVPLEGLLCPAFISRRKNSLETARAARKMKVPVTFVGGVAMDDPDYIEQFKAEMNGNTVCWAGHVSEPRQLAARLRGARGVVLASRSEGVPLTVLEALACRRPVLVSDLRNMRAYFGATVRYCSPAHEEQFGMDLAEFWEFCRSGEECPPMEILHWGEVGRRVHEIYLRVLSVPVCC